MSYKKLLILGLVLVFILSLSGLSFAKTKITYWQFMMNDETAKKIVSQFEKENPDIQVEVVQLSWANGLDKITTSIAAGTPPDVVELGNTWVANFAANGAIEDLSDWAASVKDKYSGWETTEYKGKYYAIPWLLGTRALFYNVGLFEKAGLNPDNPPETWEDVYRAAEKIDALGDGIYGIGLCSGENYSPWQQWFLPAVWSNGGSILKNNYTKANLTSCEVRETAKFYQALSKHALKSKQGDLAKAFGEGKLGMYVSGAWDIGTLMNDYPDTEFDVALIPKASLWKGAHVSFAGAEVLAIPVAGKHKEAVREFIEFLIRPDIAMQITKLVPSVFPSAVGADKDPWFDEHPLHLVFYEQNKTTRPAPPIPSWTKVQAALSEMVEALILEGKDVDSTLNYYNKKVQAILDVGK